jgi:hypothetical protein
MVLYICTLFSNQSPEHFELAKLKLCSYQIFIFLLVLSICSVNDSQNFMFLYRYTRFSIFCCNKDTQHKYHLHDHFSIQFNGIKYIHIVVQISPISGPKILYFAELELHMHLKMSLIFLCLSVPGNISYFLYL